MNTATFADVGPVAAHGESGTLKELVGSAAQGDVHAFDRLYRATAPILLRLIRRITPHCAEDVLAESYLQIWRSLDRYDPARGEVLGWMGAIARSRAIDWVRRDTADAFDTSERQEPACAAEEWPEHRLWQRQQQQEVDRLMRTLLSARERTVITLSFFRDHSHGEIASLVRLPLGTVKSILRRSQDKIRTYYRDGSSYALPHAAERPHG